jgi:hypothetical protein
MIAGKFFSQHFITGVKYKTFKSEDGAYSVSVPTKMESDINTLNTPAGPVSIYMHFARDKNLGIEYGVSHYKLPDALKSHVAGDGIKVYFDNMINGMLQDNGGKLAGKKNIEFRGYPGIECEIKLPKDKVIKAKTYFIKNTIYQIIVNCFYEDLDNKKVRDFFDSFELTGR